MVPLFPPAARRVPARLLLALVAPLMLAALGAGLVRMGWPLPLPSVTLAAAHGPLFVCGVLGTLIGLERAVALGRRWAYGGPLLTAAGGIALVAGAPVAAGALLVLLGSLVLLAVFIVLLPRAPARYLATMALGALAWCVANALWLAGRPLALVALWWAGFLVLTILGERLELGRLRQLPVGALRGFTAACALFGAGLVVAAIALDLGTRIWGAGALALAAWLLRYDIARRTVRRPGSPRYTAICILSGSVWLGVSGATALVAGALYAGPLYDALLHALFVGFVLAMVFGHAPVIVPAVLGVPLAFSRAAYLPLAALHLSLALRITGDLAGLGELRRRGGMLNAVTLGMFVAVMLASAWRARREESGAARRAVSRART